MRDKPAVAARSPLQSFAGLSVHVITAISPISVQTSANVVYETSDETCLEFLNLAITLLPEPGLLLFAHLLTAYGSDLFQYV